MKNPVIIITAVVILVISFFVYTETSFFVKGYVKVKDGMSVLVGPALKGVSTAASGVGYVFQTYFNLVGAKKENYELKRHVEDLQVQNQKLADMERENKRLKNILAFMQQSSNTLIAARVTGEDLKNWYKCIIVDKGKNAGLKEKMTVVTARGLVGQIVEVHQWHSKVMVINDTNSSVDVFLEGKNTRGILEGTGQTTLRLKYVRKTDEAEIGDKLVTSGKDGVYPKGLLVGIITSVVSKRAGIFADIDVMPYNDFKKLDEVMIVKK